MELTYLPSLNTVSLISYSIFCVWALQCEFFCSFVMRSNVTDRQRCSDRWTYQFSKFSINGNLCETIFPPSLSFKNCVIIRCEPWWPWPFDLNGMATYSCYGNFANYIGIFCDFTFFVWDGRIPHNNMNLRCKNAADTGVEYQWYARWGLDVKLTRFFCSGSLNIYTCRPTDNITHGSSMCE